jgi:hypothetical protein
MNMWMTAASSPISWAGDPGDLASPRLLFHLTNGFVSYIDYYYPSNINVNG